MTSTIEKPKIKCICRTIHLSIDISSEFKYLVIKCIFCKFCTIYLLVQDADVRTRSSLTNAPVHTNLFPPSFGKISTIAAIQQYMIVLVTSPFEKVYYIFLIEKSDINDIYSLRNNIPAIIRGSVPSLSNSPLRSILARLSFSF